VSPPCIYPHVVHVGSVSPVLSACSGRRYQVSLGQGPRLRTSRSCSCVVVSSACKPRDAGAAIAHSFYQACLKGAVQRGRGPLVVWCLTFFFCLTGEVSFPCAQGASLPCGGPRSESVDTRRSGCFGGYEPCTTDRLTAGSPIAWLVPCVCTRAFYFYCPKYSQINKSLLNYTSEKNPTTTKN
jgi:hypothetical protein